MSMHHSSAAIITMTTVFSLLTGCLTSEEPCGAAGDCEGEAGWWNEEEQLDPIVGQWISPERLTCEGHGSYDASNELYVDDITDAEADLYLSYEVDGMPDCTTARFEGEIEVLLDGEEYRLWFECTSEDALEYDCTDLDFVMNCTMDEEIILCTGTELWAHSTFEWVRL